MDLLLPISIIGTEIHPLRGRFSLSTVIKSAKKVSKGLGISLPGAPQGAKFIKTKITSSQGAGRILFLVKLEESYLLPLLLRSKNDKVGFNMSPQNILFLRQVRKNLDLAMEDIAAGDFEL